MMEQKWFEMAGVARRKLNAAVWVPLRASQTLHATARRGHLGHCEEFFGAGSIAVPPAKRASAETLYWTDLGLRQSHKGSCRDGRYVPADVFDGWDLELGAIALALSQDGNSDDPREWHLHQDFIITLGLKREGDAWVAMDEGYIEVARLKREDKQPVLLEVRAEHLKDYLCARGMALYVSSYRSREEVVADASHITWPTSPFQQGSDHDRWEGRKADIIEGGWPFGSSMKVMHVGRENLDVSEDVPKVGPFDENLVSESWTVQHEGEKLTRVEGELWRDEWVEPALQSPRVRGDNLPSLVFFVTDASGTRCSADKLEGIGGWLWFRPEVVAALLSYRGAELRWYTRDTGGLRCSPATSHVHFGVNKLGRVNIYAKDMIYLPPWIQTIWAGFNVGPEGGVSEELLAAQAAGTPAETQAPEKYLPKAFDLLNELSNTKLGFRLFRAHDQVNSITAAAHRFRSTDSGGLFALSKDLARLTADAIDASAIQKIIAPPKDQKWGSLKSLEKLVAICVAAETARSILGPLAAIYELRHGDAHLPSSDVEAAFALAHVNRSAPFVIQGYQLLRACVSSLYSVAEMLERFPDRAS
jgi:hypothetical protein